MQKGGSKGNIRLMKAFEIQSNFQKHKDKIKSIQTINRKRNPETTSINRSNASTAYQKSRTKAEVFNHKSRQGQINIQNTLLLQKLEKQATRQSRVRKNLRTSSSSSARSNLSSSFQGNNLKKQNQRMYLKLNKTKSIYNGIRTKSKSYNTNTSKGQVLNLLINQFGVRPQVLFPSISKNKQLYYSKNKKNSSSQNKPLNRQNDQVKFQKNHLQHFSKIQEMQKEWRNKHGTTS